MATIRLGIHKDYVPSWKVWEGIRDLCQNALDEEDKGHKLTAKYWENSSTLELLNDGSSLPEEALLIGFTTKADGKSRGQYGEGLKLAMLALVRNGCKVRVSSGGRSYIPAIEPDPAMNGAETLVIRTAKCADAAHTKVWVSGLAPADWVLIQSRFTKWAGYTDTIETSSGTLIRDPSAKGKVYVKGIWACDVNDLAFGYDLRNCGLDRDRNVPRQYELEYYTGMILSEATKSNSIAVDVLVSVIKSGSTEGRNLPTYTFPADAVAAQVLLDHPNADAFAYDDAEAREATPDMKVVVLPNRAKELLGSKLPTVQKVLQTRRMTPRAIYSESDLTSTESANLDLFSQLVTGDPDSALAADMDNVVSTVPAAGKNKDGSERLTPVVRRRNLRDAEGLAEALVDAPSHAGASHREILRELLRQRAELQESLRLALDNIASKDDYAARAEEVMRDARKKANEIESEAARLSGERGSAWIQGCEKEAREKSARILADAKSEADSIICNAEVQAEARFTTLVDEVVDRVSSRILTREDLHAAVQELL